MHVVIFEGSGWESLAPLSFSRPIFWLLCGTGTLLEKQLRFLKPTRLTLWVRPQLAEYCRRHVLPSIRLAGLTQPVQINEPLDSEPAHLVDGRTLFLEPPAIQSGVSVSVEEGTSRIRQASVSAAGLGAADALNQSARWNDLLALPHIAPQGRCINYLWDLLGANEEALLADAFIRRDNRAAVPDGPWHILGKDQLLLEEGVTLGPGCVIDASKGPVILASGSIIGANSVVQGPCFIGPKSEITPLSLIRPGTSIGPQSKLGGEVARAIVIGFSNKAHEGYLGDSYIGQWVNLGAGTTTSNLKNTYGSIGMHLGGNELDTGRKFLGSLIGDHTKTAIGTRFMSGSYAGFCSMIATSVHAPRMMPSFRFLTDKGSIPYRIEKSFEVARAVFARRNRDWTSEDESLMRYAADVAESAEGGKA